MLNIITSIAKFRRERLLQLQTNAAAPRLISQPQLLSGAVYYNPQLRLNTLVGIPLSVAVGVWDETDGPTTVVGQWIKLTGIPGANATFTPVGPENQTTYVSQPGDLSKRLLWQETATRGGVVVISRIPISIFVSAPWAGKPFVTVGPSYEVTDFAISGNSAPGATLTKPTYVWADPYGEILPMGMTVVSRWWKNGTDTGADGDLPYSATTDRDRIVHRSTATNVEGSTTFSTVEFDVSRFLTAFAAENVAQFTPLIAGKAGGAANMDVYSARDDIGYNYTRNPDNWLAPYIAQLTGLPALKEWVDKSDHFGGIPITPRHLLYCQHAHPRATGTWYPNLNSPPCKLTWVLPDNRVVQAIQICQTEQAYYTGNPAEDAYMAALPSYIDFRNHVSARYNVAFTQIDLCVAVLDTDIGALGIPITPIPNLTFNESAALSDLSTTGQLGNTPLLFSISQGDVVGRPGNTPIGAYPFKNRAMTYLKYGAYWVAAAPFTPFSYDVYKGDSGSPVFFMHRGVVYLHNILVAAPYGGIPVANFVTEINMMIARADEGAVAMGRMSAVTGLTVTAVRPPSA